MSRANVRQYAAHLGSQGKPPVVPRLPDVTGYPWPRTARRSPVECAPETEADSDTSEAPLASPRVNGAPLRSVSKARSEDRLAVTLTVAELRELVRDVALEVQADAGSNAPPALLDRNGIARALGVGLSTVDRWRKAGMPAVFVGDSPRFIFDEAMAWVCEHRRSADSDEGGQP